MLIDVEQRARSFMEALLALERGSEADVAGLTALFADDAELHNSALDLRHGAIAGRDRIAEFWAEYKRQLGGARTRFEEVMTGEDTAGLFWTTEGEDSRGGPINYHGCSLLRFDERGRVAYFRGYYDTRQLQLRAGGRGAGRAAEATTETRVGGYGGT